MIIYKKEEGFPVDLTIDVKEIENKHIGVEYEISITVDGEKIKSIISKEFDKIHKKFYAQAFFEGYYFALQRFDKKAKALQTLDELSL